MAKSRGPGLGGEGAGEGRAAPANGMDSAPRAPLAQDEDVAAAGEADSQSSLGGSSDSERRVDKFGFLVAEGGDGAGPEAPLEEVPLEVLRQRESKWLDMLNNWDKWMAKKHKKIRLRCQKGIPPSLRGRAWQYLSGAKVKLEQNAGKFDCNPIQYKLNPCPSDLPWTEQEDLCLGWVKFQFVRPHPVHD